MSRADVCGAEMRGIGGLGRVGDVDETGVVIGAVGVGVRRVDADGERLSARDVVGDAGGV